MVKGILENGIMLQAWDRAEDIVYIRMGHCSKGTGKTINLMVGEEKYRFVVMFM
jgi:hypothetical protein